MGLNNIYICLCCRSSFASIILMCGRTMRLSQWVVYHILHILKYKVRALRNGILKKNHNGTKTSANWGNNIKEELKVGRRLVTHCTWGSGFELQPHVVTFLSFDGVDINFTTTLSTLTNNLCMRIQLRLRKCR